MASILMKDIKTYKSKDDLEKFLAEDVVKHLKQDIDKHGIATLLLSGGSTPIALYKKLSKATISWEDVIVGLVDERYVPADNEFSNEKMIREILLQNNASKANFVGMVAYSNNLSLNVDVVTKKYEEYFSEISYCILGMGSDAHTASLFPNDKKSEASLSEKDLSILLSTNAPNHPNRRISCGYNFLKKSKKMTLMLYGKEKLDVLSNAKQNNLPISKFLDYTEIHYAE